jgi:hypothetical protein
MRHIVDVSGDWYGRLSEEEINPFLANLAEALSNLAAA